MLADPHDTIVALASAAGPGGRGIVRLSGQRAFDIARGLGFAVPGVKRGLCATSLHLEGLSAPLPCDAYFFLEPRSYTGEDVVELHLIGSPPLLDLVLTACLRGGARAALPGEFTLRAFRAGKLDLTRAEAVLGVIDASSRDELKLALAQLAGGMAAPLTRLREELLDLLADVEAVLDFADEDIPHLTDDELLHRLAAALAQAMLLKRQVEQRAVADRPFRVVLAGPVNAGKSSLFNALVGKKAALVSPTPGTTRDYLEVSLDVEGVRICLVDTAGARETGDVIESRAQGLGSEQRQQADLVLWCRDASLKNGEDVHRTEPSDTRFMTVWTKVDLASARGAVATSAVTGAGLVQLKQELARRAGERARPALAASVSRCRHHIEAALAALRRAHAIVLEEDPRELLALELRTALDEIGAMAGTVFTEDLLDRIFSRFCIGK